MLIDRLSSRERFSKIQRKIIEINFFSKTVWIKKENLKRQRWTTRIFLLCLILCCIIRTIYIIVEKKTTKNTISFPNQNQYENLLKISPDSLKCPCTNISINNEKFFSINPIYHEICSSEFINYLWYSHLQIDVDVIPSDFRVYSSSLFHFIEVLCAATTNLINLSMKRFLKSSFISYNLIEENSFNKQSSEISKDFIQMTKREFSDILELISSLSSSSQFISFANQNSVGILHQNVTPFYQQKPFDHELSFNDSCYCSRDLYCEKDAIIYHVNKSIQQLNLLLKVKGFVITCSILDSLLKSSPECLYNLTCMDQWLATFKHIHVPRITLNSNKQTRFPFNTTFQSIIYELFVENWQMKYSYSKFYNQCLPVYCEHPILTRNSFAIIITHLIALYGGLTVALEIILPHLINLTVQCFLIFKRNSNQTQQQQQQPGNYRKAKLGASLLKLHFVKIHFEYISY